jgi:hypothetical protein
MIVIVIGTITTTMRIMRITTDISVRDAGRSDEFEEHHQEK